MGREEQGGLGFKAGRRLVSVEPCSLGPLGRSRVLAPLPAVPGGAGGRRRAALTGSPLHLGPQPRVTRECVEAVLLLRVTEQPSSRTFAGGDCWGRSVSPGRPGPRQSVHQAPSPPGLPGALGSSASSSQVPFSPTRPRLLGFLLVPTHTRRDVLAGFAAAVRLQGRLVGLADRGQPGRARRVIAHPRQRQAEQLRFCPACP